MQARSISSDATKLRTMLWMKITKAQASRAQFASAARLAALSESSATLLGTVATCHVTEATRSQYSILIEQTENKCFTLFQPIFWLQFIKVFVQTTN